MASAWEAGTASIQGSCWISATSKLGVPETNGIHKKTEIERAFLERLNLEAQSRLAEVADFCRTTEAQRLRERKKRTNMSELYAA